MEVVEFLDTGRTHTPLLQSVPRHLQGFFEELLRVPGNDLCADCLTPGPNHAAFDFGLLLCEQCAAIHRKILTDTTPPSEHAYVRPIFYLNKMMNKNKKMKKKRKNRKKKKKKREEKGKIGGGKRTSRG